MRTEGPRIHYGPALPGPNATAKEIADFYAIAGEPRQQLTDALDLIRVLPSEPFCDKRSSEIDDEA